MRRPLAATPIVLVLTLALASCGGSGADQGREDALASLEQATAASSLQTEMGQLVAQLASNPEPAQRRQLQRRLRTLDAKAAALVSGADARYSVNLASVNGSGAAGTATLAESGGKIALSGSVNGMAPGRAHPVALHALSPAEGSSVCPPGGAAAGPDRQLSGTEAQDFYGPPVVNFSEASGPALASAREAGAAPPLTARTLVISGGGGGGTNGFDAGLPIACGVPEADVAAGARDADAETIAAINDARGALFDLAAAAANPTSSRGKQARSNAERRLKQANQRLGGAIQMAVTGLKDSGDLSNEEQAKIDQASKDLEAAKTTIDNGFTRFDKLVAQEEAAAAEREAQRQAAQQATEAPSSPSPSTSSSSSPSPAPSGGGGGGPSVVIK